MADPGIRHYYQWMDKGNGAKESQPAPIYITIVGIKYHEDYVEIEPNIEWFAHIGFDGCSHKSKDSFRFIMASDKLAQLETNNTIFEIARDLIQEGYPNLDVQ